MLKNDNLELRPFEEDDIRLFYDWLNREESMGDYAGFNVNPCQMIRKKHEDGYYWNEHRKYFIIEVGNIPVGEVVIHKALNYHTSGLEIALCIDEQEYRKKGYGKKIVDLLLDYIFNNNPDINRVQAVIDSQNVPSANLFKSCGFTYEGILRGINFHHGEFRDAHLYSILKKEWKNLKN